MGDDAGVLFGPWKGRSGRADAWHGAASADETVWVSRWTYVSKHMRK